MLIFSFITSSVLCTFSEISMLNNSSIAMFPYPYILWIDGILLERIFMDLKLIYVLCVGSLLRPFRSSYWSGERSSVTR